MQLKWLEDFVALAQAQSFSRAAELRHVTHPAFGRRIQALEDWAGTPLVERGSSPVRLTAAGLALLEHAQDTVRGVGLAREALQSAAGRQQRTVTLATGRTLARTLVADWLCRHRALLDQEQAEVQIRTRALAETAQMLEHGEADFILTYHHPVLALRLSARQFSHLTLAQDRLVPVSRCDANGHPRFGLQGSAPAPHLAYAPNLALGRLVDDHLAHHPQAPALRRFVACDSADALLEYALQGLGVAWLPWSMAASACQAGHLTPVGDERLQVVFEVRLYRAKRRLQALPEALWAATLAG